MKCVTTDWFIFLHVGNPTAFSARSPLPPLIVPMIGYPVVPKH